MIQDVNNGKTIASILAETKDDVKRFFETRLTLFRAELGEKFKIIGKGAPLAIVAILLLGTAYMLFTLSLVGLVVGFFPGNSFRWCFAFLAVAVLWTIMGVVVGAIAKRRLQFKELVPNRTIGVLKGDGIWIQSEVKNQI